MSGVTILLRFFVLNSWDDEAIETKPLDRNTEAQLYLVPRRCG